MGVTMAQIQKTISLIQQAVQVVATVKKALGNPDSIAASELENSLTPLARKLSRQVTAFGLRRKRKKRGIR